MRDEVGDFISGPNEESAKEVVDEALQALGSEDVEDEDGPASRGG